MQNNEENIQNFMPTFLGKLSMVGEFLKCWPLLFIYISPVPPHQFFPYLSSDMFLEPGENLFIDDVLPVMWKCSCNLLSRKISRPRTQVNSWNYSSWQTWHYHRFMSMPTTILFGITFETKWNLKIKICKKSKAYCSKIVSKFSFPSITVLNIYLNKSKIEDRHRIWAYYNYQADHYILRLINYLTYTLF